MMHKYKKLINKQALFFLVFFSFFVLNCEFVLASGRSQ